MQLLALLQWPVSPSHMCDMLNLRTFIDLQMQSSTRPAPPQTALQIKRKASPFKLCFPFMYAVRALFVRVRLRYGGLSRFLFFFFFHFCCILSGWGWLHSCMHELSSRYNWWDLSLFFSLSLQLPHHPAPRSAAVNESGLIFLYLLHPTFNLGDEIDQENKRSYCILLYYVFDCLPSSLENSLRWYKTGITGTDIHMTWGILVEELDHLGNALIGFFVKIEEWYCSLEY